MKIPSFLSSLVVALTALAGFPTDARADVNGDGKTVLCFVGHKTSHGFMKHEYMAGCRLIEAWLAEVYPEANIEGRYAVPWPEDEETFYQDADAVIFFCSGGGGHVVNNHVPEFDKVMRTGAGLSCLHYGVEVPIGPSAKGMLAWMGGYFEKNWSVNPHWVAEFTTFNDHEAARGIKPFKMDDEWYFHMRFVGDMEGVTPILSAVAPEETMKRPDGPHSGNPTVRKAVAAGDPQHVAWTYQRGENYKDGRGFGFTGLHYHWNWEDDNFRKAVLNGVAWTAKLPIPEGGIETPTPTREFLEENAAKWGGEQGRKKAASGGGGAKPVAVGQPAAKPLFESPVIRSGNPPSHSVDIDVALPPGSKELVLVMGHGGDGVSHDWAAWAEPRLLMGDGTERLLTDFDWKAASNGHGRLHKNANCQGQPIKVNGKVIENGIGGHANSVIVYDLPKGAKRFQARGVLDDGGTVRGGEKTPTSVQFLVFNEAPKTAGGQQTSADAYVKKTSAPGRDAGEALDTLVVHPDLEAQLFASEPMITSPSSIDIDAKGRVWVCDVVNYRRNQGKRVEGDRILILEDTDADAKADKSTVFYQGEDVNSAHGICVLGDRVIISAGDDIFSLYDRDGDGKADPDSKEILFTNIGGKQHDHGIHAVHFGPDGRLYFNFGNAGKRLCDPEGNLITDINGIPCTAENNRPYQEGIIFRCDLDGKNVEMLAWNFRNNWEVCVDSFGALWQSDNDDDGNKAVRINAVLEYGNYGYKDEMTGAGWRDPRPGMSEEIPLRHFHQNDPGVVPNLLQTGAGSPTGICVYEGDLLPEIFRGQVIHCDAGPNVVRSYPVKPQGAGYQAEIVDILTNTADRWFRPSDVCVAPDGSLFVADWYDPGVGGHGMGDIEKGRIYRVIPKGNEMAKQYALPPSVHVGVPSKFKNPPFTRIQSPNASARYEAWQAFAKSGDEAASWLSDSSIGYANESASPRLRARAFWMVLAGENPVRIAEAITALAESGHADLACTAIRGWRQVAGSPVTNPEFDPTAYVATLKAIEKANSDLRVRRECATALRYVKGEAADGFWAELAAHFDGEDRWYLEALGIGADLCWDERLAAVEGDLDPLLLWRSRGSTSAEKIAEVLVASSEPSAAFLRALDFQGEEDRTAAFERVFLKGGTEMALVSAGRIGRVRIERLPGGADRLEALLAPVRGKAEFVTLAQKLNLRGFESELADFIVDHPDDPASVLAARQILLHGGKARELLKASPEETLPLIVALGRTGERSAADLLDGLLKEEALPVRVHLAAVNAMANSGHGGRKLIERAKKGELPDRLQATAALAIARSPDQRLRGEAKGVLEVPKAAGADQFPPVAELAKKKGDASKGPDLFAKATCATCHKVKGEGIDFGPDLSEIGNKLSREAMFEAILYPSVAISHGFHGVNVTREDGSTLVGYTTGETDDELQLRLPGGVDQKIPSKEINSRQELDQSLMPPGLAAVIGEEGLVDLVDWLQTLK